MRHRPGSQRPLSAQAVSVAIESIHLEMLALRREIAEVITDAQPRLIELYNAYSEALCALKPQYLKKTHNTTNMSPYEQLVAQITDAPPIEMTARKRGYLQWFLARMTGTGLSPRTMALAIQAINCNIASIEKEIEPIDQTGDGEDATYATNMQDLSFSYWKFGHEFEVFYERAYRRGLATIPYMALMRGDGRQVYL